MLDQPTVDAVRAHAARLKIEAAVLFAVLDVESNGRTFELIKGRKEPLIRWEGHYFDQRLTGDERDEARRKGLAHPRAGAIKNPNSQVKRWQMLIDASRINPQAAFESASYGVGQVMGAHWKRLGFASVQAFVEKAREGVAGQVEIMVRYIVAFGLVDELQRKDFVAFARAYNGPAGIKAGYHLRLANAYDRRTGRPPVSAATGMLRMGSKGAKVRELQALLVRAGYPVKVDGDYGPTTKKVVSAFQKARGLTVDGVAGPETVRMLSQFKAAPDEAVGAVAAQDVQEVRDATKGGGVLVAVVAVREQITETAGHLVGLDAEFAKTAANAMLAGAGLIGAGLALYALYGWWRSQQTEEGDVPA